MWRERPGLQLPRRLSETVFIIMENNLCIYCGSAVGADARFAESARNVGRAMARHGFGLVYGGGRVGLMGIVADAVLEGGGRAIGVIPEPLAAKEIAHRSLTELHVVHDMHQRKAMMASRSNAFLTLPGGIGTLRGVLRDAELGRAGACMPKRWACSISPDTSIR